MWLRVRTLMADVGLRVLIHSFPSHFFSLIFAGNILGDLRLNKKYLLAHISFLFGLTSNYPFSNLLTKII